MDLIERSVSFFMESDYLKGPIHENTSQFEFKHVIRGNRLSYDEIWMFQYKQGNGGLWIWHRCQKLGYLYVSI